MLILVSFVFPFNLGSEGRSAYYNTFSSLLGGGKSPNAGIYSFPSLLIPPGGVYEAMGTAQTALVSGESALELNPAASSLLSTMEFSLMHNDWITNGNVEGLFYAMRKGSWGWGGGIKLFTIPFTGTNHVGRRLSKGEGSFATGYYTETIASANLSYRLFDNFAWFELSVGGNFKAAFRGVSSSLQEYQSGVGLMVDAGLLLRADLGKTFVSRERNFGVGLSLLNLGAELITDPDPLPSSVGVGIAYQPIRFLLIAADFRFPFALFDADWVWHHNDPYGAVGINFIPTKLVAFQLGALLKRGLPRFTIGTTLSLTSLDFSLNYTLDLTTRFSELDRISLAIKVDVGAFIGRLKERKAERFYATGLVLYGQGKRLKAMESWEKALEILPTFLPAQKMIAFTERSIEFEDSMSAIGR